MVIVALSAWLGASAVAGASWYWYTSAGFYGGVAPNDTRNSGFYNGYNGEMTNENFGTRKSLLYDAQTGPDWVRSSQPDGDPRVWGKAYPGTVYAKHYCRNDYGGNVSVKCGWNTY